MSVDNRPAMLLETRNSGSVNIARLYGLCVGHNYCRYLRMWGVPDKVSR